MLQQSDIDSYTQHLKSISNDNFHFPVLVFRHWIMTESIKRLQKLNFIKMVWPQINLFHSLATPAAGHKRAKEFYGRSFRGYCARMVGVTMIIKACFYTTFYARKKSRKYISS